MDAALERRLAVIADREEILDLVRRERFARDQRHWQVMRDCFHDEAYVRTSWYDGVGGEAYVEASRQVVTSPERKAQQSNGKHWVFPGFLQQSGDRATVESPAMIFNRIRLGGVAVDFHVFCRFFSRVLRREGVWRLLSFEVVFERDIMRCTDAAQALPVDPAVLATYRPSYKFLTCVQESRGYRVNPDLWGDDRREALEGFYAGEAAWLAA
jgi:hypothetical protein